METMTTFLSVCCVCEVEGRPAVYDTKYYPGPAEVKRSHGYCDPCYAKVMREMDAYFASEAGKQYAHGGLLHESR